MTDAEYAALVTRLDEHYDARYRSLERCDERHGGLDGRIDKINAAVNTICAKVEVLSDHAATTNKWLGVLATAVITAIVGYVVLRALGGA